VEGGGGEEFSSQNKHPNYQNKNPKVKCQIRTLFTTLEMTLFMRAATLFTTLHR